MKQGFDQQVSVMEQTYLYHPDPGKSDRRKVSLFIIRMIILILVDTFTHTAQLILPHSLQSGTQHASVGDIFNYHLLTVRLLINSV